MRVQAAFSKHFRRIHHEDVRIDQTFRVQLGAEFHPLLVFFHEGRILHGIAIQIQVVGIAHEAHQGLQFAQIGRSVSGRQGDFILFAVAVGILVAECHQGFIVLIHGLGHFQAQRIQPLLVDVKNLVRALARASFDFHVGPYEAADFARGQIYRQAHIRVVLIQVPEIGGVFLQIGLEV